MFSYFTTQLLERTQEKGVDPSVAKANLWMLAVEETVNFYLTHLLCFVLIPGHVQ